ncbi:hypothetical protein ACFOLG_13255 [Vogesella facilis]|uniref:Uncharacterized protein n=1 Tax=Vogesella facilis TaxID=1655232 RepID=A0ABV7RL25_9NEIS
MMPIRRKLLDGFSSTFPPLQQQGRSMVAASSMPAANPQNLAEEYLAWARWLDELHRHANNGGEREVRALADGKLGFVLRRCMVLREKSMLGGSAGHVLLDEAAHLARELEQVVGELSGREMTAVDEWPLPYRLYSRQAPASHAPTAPPRGHRERRQGREHRQNLLTAAERHDAQLALGSLLLVLQLLRRWPALAEAPAWRAANLSLSRTRQMGHLAAEPTPPSDRSGPAADSSHTP